MKHVTAKVLAALAMVGGMSAAQALEFAPLAIGGPIPASTRYVVEASGGTLFTIAKGLVYTSTDGGASWAPTSAQPAGTISDTASNGNSHDIAATGSHLYVITNGASGGVFHSTDGGASWTNKTGDHPVVSGSFGLTGIAMNSTYIFSYTSNKIYRAALGASTWTEKTADAGVSVNQIYPAGSNLCLARLNSTAKYSTDNGDTWNDSATTIDARAIDGNASGSVVFATGDAEAQVSTDGCASFTAVAHTGVTFSGGEGIPTTVGVAGDADFYVGFINGKVYRSTDGGATFALDNSGPISPVSGARHVYKLARTSAGVFVSTEMGMYRKSDTWVDANTGLGRGYAYAMINRGAGKLGFLFQGKGYYVSDDGGQSMTQRIAGMDNTNPLALVKFGDTLVMGTGVPAAADGTPGLYYSTNDGLSWSVGTGIPNGARIEDVASDGTRVYAHVSSANCSGSGCASPLLGIYVSTDGIAWTKKVSGLPATDSLRSLAANGAGAFVIHCGSLTCDVYKTTDGGDNWAQSDTGITSDTPVWLYTTANGLVAFTSEQTMFYSTDGGASWSAASGFPGGSQSFSLNGMTEDDTGTLYAIHQQGKLAYSTDHGATWTADTTGLPSDSFTSVHAQDGNVYVSLSAGPYASATGPAGPDRTPNTFAFTDQSNVEQGAAITSNAVAITGIDEGTAISVSNGEYSIGCSSFTSISGTIDSGQTVCVRHTSASTAATTVNTVLTVGTRSDTFSSTTASAGGSDGTPDAFAFTDQSGVASGAVVQSNAITVSGIDTAAAISVSGGQYRIGDGSYTAAAGTVTNGQTVTVRVTAGAGGETVSATLTIGGVSDTFSATTAGDTEMVAAGPGAGTAVSSNTGTITNLVNSATAPAAAPSGYTYPFGFFSFDITGIANGATVTVQLALPAAGPDAYVKCNSAGTSCTPFAGASIAGSVVTLTLVDGGAGDADGLANGTIADPGAPATTVVVTTPPPAAATDSGGGAVGLGSLPWGLLALLARRRRASRERCDA
jgi:hypothetical protein